MREFNALEGYPEPKEPRFVNPNLRTIHHRIIASQRGAEFYDGDRNYGYGGLVYDGRWIPIVENICKEYSLTEKSSVLQIGSDKGFLLYDFMKVKPGINVRGLDISKYPIENSLSEVKPFLQFGQFTDLPFTENEFDFVIALGPVYTLNLPDAINCLKEIQRVGKGRSFITLGAYENEQDLKLLKYWSLLGTTILKAHEWREVLSYAGFTGDYSFVTAKSLKLVEKDISDLE